MKNAFETRPYKIVRYYAVSVIDCYMTGTICLKWHKFDGTVELTIKY